MVEPQPSKLMMWVRSPSPAPAWIYAHIAQSVEHFLGKEEVTGSNPVVGSIGYGPATAWPCVRELTKVEFGCYRPAPVSVTEVVMKKAS